MNSLVDINSLSPKEKAAFVTMYYARFKTDSPEYAYFEKDLSLISQSFNIKYNTLKNHRDAFDACYPDNDRVGWVDKPLENRDKILYAIYSKYGAIDIIQHKLIVDDILAFCNKIIKENGDNFIALRVQKPEQAHLLLDPTITELEIDDVYSLFDAIKPNAIVFLALGGDTSVASVDWDRGFYALGHVSTKPYDVGYNHNAKNMSYYKFRVSVDWRGATPYPKTFFQCYPDSYDSPYISLELHRDPTQAICSLNESKAVSIIRAIIDDKPELLSEMTQIFTADFIEKVKGTITRLVPTCLPFGQNKPTCASSPIIIDESTRIFYGTNIILYGVPGCGKSFTVDKDYLQQCHYHTRVVFHPDYTNADFIGQILPQTKEDPKNPGTNIITYDFIPGPFTTAIKNAYEHPKEKHVFVIEEINRGNAAAIFGETFQLLDRLTAPEGNFSKGTSRYGITNENMANEIYGDKDHEVRIPSNLTIVATMNTSDQNVFPLDTAFKRRWKMKNIPNNFNNCELSNNAILGTLETWAVFAKTVNAMMSNLNSSMMNNEDKRLGAYFVTQDELADANLFAEKVMAYLWDDAFKFCRDKVFISSIHTLEDLITQFKSIKLKVFTDLFKNTSEQFKYPTSSNN